MSEKIEVDALTMTDATAVGLMVRDTGDTDVTWRCIPFVLSLDDAEADVHTRLEGYTDRFEIDGEVATDAEALAFLKRLTRHWDAALQASGVCDE